MKNMYSEQEQKDRAAIKAFEGIANLNINWIGLDPGEIFAIAAACIRNEIVASTAIKTKSYFNATMGISNDTLARWKERVVNGKTLASMEDGSVDAGEGPLWDLYRNESGMKLDAFVRRTKQRWLDLAFQSVCNVAGCTADQKADEYLKENKAFVFVFETGADFASSESIHAKVQKHIIKKLRALGHLVVGMDKYRTSQGIRNLIQGCPICFGKISMVPDKRKRIKFCSNCKLTIHRDIASGLLIARLAELLWKEGVKAFPDQFKPPWEKEAEKDAKRRASSPPSLSHSSKKSRQETPNNA